MPEEDPPAPLPVVVLAHGYSGDRVGLSTLGRWLARNGYAAVTFDVRGHGTNNSPFIGDIRDDLITVLDKIDDGGDFDPSRIALVGHSMGAFLAVEHASRDERIKATVALAGGDTATVRFSRRTCCSCFRLTATTSTATAKSWRPGWSAMRSRKGRPKATSPRTPPSVWTRSRPVSPR